MRYRESKAALDAASYPRFAKKTKQREEWGTHWIDCANKFQSLGHPPQLQVNWNLPGSISPQSE
jgi:hypothetical protein